jgi:hypothetical protein
MHILDLTYVLVASKDTKDPLILTCRRAINVPFAPFPGLVITLTREGQEMGGDFICDDVVWDQIDQIFLCEDQREFDHRHDAIETLREFVDMGWDTPDRGVLVTE